jgi:hypothetical protein
MVRFFIAVCLLTLLSPIAGQSDDMGSIDFPTSGSKSAQVHFLEGAAALHSFGRKQARVAFQKAQAIDPGFAMAYWGDSLTYNHPLTAEWDIETPKQVLTKLGDTPAKRLAAAPTERERGFLSAVEALFFGEGDTRARRVAYREVMASMYQRFPDDDEIAAHYALALLGAAGRAGDGQRQNVLAGAIAMEISRRNPRHPGAVHYTIHAFDDPVHAPLALHAADVFDDIAPAVSHARHMPTHIYIQHGMWQQVSDSNQSAYDAAVALWESGDEVSDMAHALDWGQYGDLQLGDFDRAALWIDRMQDVLGMNPGQQRIIDILPHLKARMIVETQRWEILPITETTTDSELLATGLSAVALNRLDLARSVVDRLGERAAVLGDGDQSYYARTGKPLLVMQHSVGGALAVAEGDTELGLSLLQRAVEIAESMRPPNGPANPLKPAHELYGEALLSAGKPKEALQAFQTSLSRTPNRSLSMQGLARSYTALGDQPMANHVSQKLPEVFR